MLFAINNRIFNTKDIHSITAIKTSNYSNIYHEFTICFFKAKEITVTKDSGCYYNGDNYCVIEDNNGNELYKDYETGSLQKCIESEQYKKTLNELSELRNKIIDLWNDDKSKIIQFTI